LSDDDDDGGSARYTKDEGYFSVGVCRSLPPCVALVVKTLTDLTDYLSETHARCRW